MARTLGIPSRIATGYAQGQFDSKLNAYEVYQNNAHTWPEIYFPKYGWIQFEPTASQPQLVRPTTDLANPNAADRQQDPVDDAGKHNPIERPDRAPEDIDTPVGDGAFQSAATARIAAIAAPLHCGGALASAARLVWDSAYEKGGGA
jgi:transglutaminase-like putative cysteine protease